MKLKSAIILGALVAIVVLVAGCTSSGGPSATTQPPAATTATSPGTTVQSTTQPMPQSLTEAQKTQATNIVKADATMKDVLNKPGYSIVGMDVGTEAGTALVTVQGSNTQGSLWTPDQYILTVDLNKNKIADTVHISPRQLPTPQPTT